MKVYRNASVYFMLQGIAVLLWWILLLAEPRSRKYFLLEPTSDLSLMSFWLPDLVILCVGSIATSILCLRIKEYAKYAAWLLSGAIGYASLYCFVYAMKTDVGWLGVALMFPATIWTGVFAVGISVGKGMFREARDSSVNWVLAKTLSQIVIVWSLILIVFPYLITIIEDKIGIVRLQFPFQRIIAVVLFITISSIGVWAAIAMSRIGRGTPLPLDHARALVVVGPYSYVRNPMAVSGIGQGLAVALFLGSPLVLIYALTGSLIWQLVFRPLEEDELAARFGDPYTDYCDAIKCWRPALKAYQSDGTAASSNSVDSPSGSM